MDEERQIALEAARVMERAATALQSGKTAWAYHLVLTGAIDVRRKLRALLRDGRRQENHGRDDHEDHRR